MSEDPHGKTNQDRRTAYKDLEPSKQKNILFGRKVEENTG